MFGELVWDDDIQPEGVAVTATPLPAVRVTVAEYIILHRSPGKTIGLTAAQIAWKGEQARWASRIATGLYALQRPDAEGVTTLARENQGNTLTIGPQGDTTAFASRFVLVHAFGSLEYRAGSFPVLLAAQYIRNTEAATTLDGDGFAVGTQVGALKRPGTCRVYYQYQEIGREAVFSPFAQDDFLQATNMRAHVAGIQVRVLPRATAHAWILWSASEVPRAIEFQKRIRLDLDLTF